MNAFSASPASRCIALAALALAVAPLPAAAQERVAQFELGLGVKAAPAYEGSDEYKAGPSLGGSLDALSIGSINIQPGDDLGFGIAPSFRYLSERTASDHKILTGINDVDAAFELGAKVSYRWQGTEVFAAMRRGVTGHDGIVLDLGADAILQPAERTTVRIGPRVSLANEAYMDTYFSVPGTATNLAPYDADGGVKSYGLEMTVRQDLSDTWAIEGSLGYDRLSGQAGDSPIAKAGSRDQGTIGIMLIRKFNLRF